MNPIPPIRHWFSDLRTPRRPDDPTASPVPDSCIRASLRVAVIEDPDGVLCLINAVGYVTALSVDMILDELRQRPRYSALQLDLTDALISDDGAWQDLERGLDEVELRHIGIRVIGLGPAPFDRY